MNKNEMLSQLIYASSKGRYVDGPELQNILNRAKPYNSSQNISGVLFFNSRYFLQVLEGPRQNINTLYHKILTDKRHSNVQLIKMGNINSRQWSDWSMEFISIVDLEHNLCHKYTGDQQFNPYRLDAQNIDAFFSELSTLYTEN